MKSITLHASSPITVTLKANQRRRITKLQFSHSILSSPSSYFNNQTKKTQHFPRNQITNLNILVEVLLSLTYLLIARMAVLAALISASSLVLAAAPLYWMPLISTLAGVRDVHPLLVCCINRIGLHTSSFEPTLKADFLHKPVSSWRAKQTT